MRDGICILDFNFSLNQNKIDINNNVHVSHVGFIFFLPFVQGLNRDLILKIQTISSIGITFALLGVIGTIVNTRRVGECRWAGLLTCISLLISGNMITCNIFVRVSYFL